VQQALCDNVRSPSCEHCTAFPIIEEQCSRMLDRLSRSCLIHQQVLALPMHCKAGLAHNGTACARVPTSCRTQSGAVSFSKGEPTSERASVLAVQLLHDACTGLI
jgi:hypothetical protein